MKGKRVLAALCAVLLALTLGACGGGDDAGSGEKSQEEELRDTVWADVAVECKFSYADVKNVTTNVTNIEDNGDGTYTVQGKANVTDNYGDQYAGNFTAEYRYNESSGEFSKISLDIETPTRQ